MTIPGPDWGFIEPERNTRRNRRDPKLKAAGWHVLSLPEARDWRELRGSAVEEFAAASGPADYAVCDKGADLAVVEAVTHRSPAAPAWVNSYEQAAY